MTRKRRDFMSLVLLGICAFIAIPFSQSVQNQAEYKERTTLALWAAKTGTWVWDVEKNTLDWDARMFIIYGQDPATWTPNYGGFGGCLHPDDADRVNKAVMDCVKNGGRYAATFRVIDNKGWTRWVTSYGGMSKDGKIIAGTSHLVDGQSFQWEMPETFYKDPIPEYDKRKATR